MSVLMVLINNGWMLFTNYMDIEHRVNERTNDGILLSYTRDEIV